MTPEQEIAHLRAELERERARADGLQEIVHALTVKKRSAVAESEGVALGPPLIRLKTPEERAETERHQAKLAEENRLRAIVERHRRETERAAKKAKARVYFIQQDGSEGLVKIGTTTRAVEVRLKELQAGHSCPLLVRASAPGGHAQESDMHWRFAALRVSGEWFRPGPDLMAYIALVADRGAL